MKPYKTYLLLPFLFAACCVAKADGFHAGVKFGMMDHDFGGFDSALNLGILGGYDFDNSAIRLGNYPLIYGAELELTTSVANGDVNNRFGITGDWDINTQALYASAKYGSKFYGKLKLGFIHEKVTIYDGFFNIDDSDFGLSAGAGAGWHATSRFDAEVEYTLIEGDVGFISLGANYHF